MAETVSIIGMACRLPGASNVSEFWNLLIGNGDAITEVPADRFDISQYYDPTPSTPNKTLSRFGGFIDGIQDFDAGFFRISPREARAMDPQQRLLLQVVWEALEDSGIPPSTLTGLRCGVFVGQATSEYATVADTHSGDDLLGITGNGIRAVTAGRISNAFDLHGPSMVVDTACSSSLAAVHLGRQSLLSGESDLVIVAGTNLVLTPADAISYSQGDLLAADGRCKFGDAGADGFVRSDGIAAVVLKRTAEAERDGDPTRASLLGSAVNNDGEGDGLLVKPTVSGQRELVRAACHDAGIQPAELDYVEAHGTGTVVGDTVELQALSSVLDDRRAAANPLYVGSVKTNIGHTEAAAGIAGLIKATLIAEHGVIPASLHLREPNAVLAKNGSLAPVDTNRELRPLGDRAVLGVSSFGISGTNAHVIISAARDNQPAGSASGSDDGGPHALVLSARSEPALLKLAGLYADYLGPNGSGMPYDLRDICHAAAATRDAHPYRLWAVGTTRDELAAALRDLAAGRATPGGSVQRTADRSTPRVVFVFPGQGGQWIGMGRRLLEVSPTFTAAMERCDTAVRAELGWSVMARLHDPELADLHSVDVVQPVLWAVEVALAELLRAYGIDPDVCVGHSMGEVAAAHEVGALSLDQAAAVICRRSRLMKRRSGQGRMLATELSTAEAEVLVEREPGVCVAVENSPHSTVLSGEIGAIDRIAATLEERGVHHRQVNVDVASHSPQMDDVCTELLHELDDLGETAGPRAAEMASAVHDRVLTAGDLSARYWADNLRRPVLFGRAVHRLAAKSSCIFVELSPHPVLINVLHECVQDAAYGGGAIAVQNRREPEDLALVKAVGQFFAAGGVVDWNRYYGRQAPRVPLPAYQWDVEAFWTTHRSTTRQHGAGNTRTITLGELGALESCRETSVHGRSHVPLSAYLDAALVAATDPSADRSDRRGGTWTLRDVRLTGGMLDLGDAADIGLRVRIQDHESDPERYFSVEAGHRDDRYQLTGRLRRGPAGTHALFEHGTQQLDAALAWCDTYLSGTEFHHAAATRGYASHRAQPTVLHAWRRDGTAVVQVRPASTGRTAVIEAAMQALVASWPSDGDAGDTTCAYAATAVREAVVAETPDDCLWSIAWFSPDGAVRPAQADVLVLTMSGALVAAFNGISLSRLPAVTRGEDAGTRVLPLPVGDRPTHLTTIGPAHRQSEVIGHIAHVLGTSTDRIDLHKSLRDMGLDSLMAAQLRRRLATATGEPVTTAQLLEPTSAEHLIGHLHAETAERAMT